MKKINATYSVKPAKGWDNIINGTISNYFLGKVGKNLGFPSAQIGIAGSELRVNGQKILKGYGGVGDNFIYTFTELADFITEDTLSLAVGNAFKNISEKNPNMIVKGKSLLRMI